MVRKKISRLWQEYIGDGKHALGERSEEEVTINEASDIFARVPPSVTVMVRPKDDKVIEDRFLATGDEAAEYLRAVDSSEVNIDDFGFGVPHYENKRGKTSTNSFTGHQVLETGDTSFGFRIEAQLEEPRETVYGDTVPTGEYQVTASSDSMSDEDIDAVLGNIVAETTEVRVSTNELINYLSGRDVEITAEDMNADSQSRKSLRSPKMDVNTDRVVQEGDAKEVINFINSTYQDDFPDTWSGVIGETESGNTGIYHLSNPGSKGKSEGHRPKLTGEVDISYEETLEELK